MVKNFTRLINFYLRNQLVHYLLLIVPYSANTFDHKRDITALEHMIKEYNNDVDEDDSAHIDEIIFDYELGRDDGLTDYNFFINRCKNNFAIRGCHQHVFNKNNFFELLSYLKFNINTVELWYPYYMIFICTKNDDKYEKFNFLELVNLQMNCAWY